MKTSKLKKLEKALKFAQDSNDWDRVKILEHAIKKYCEGAISSTQLESITHGGATCTAGKGRRSPIQG